MSLLFAVAQLDRSAWSKLPFERRVNLIRTHYELDRWPNVHEASWYFPQSGIGVFVAFQSHERKHFSHVSSADGKTDYLTHAPFGYRHLIPSASLDQVPSELAKAIDETPSLLLRINPPQGILSIDEGKEKVRFRNDLLGLGKTFLLRGRSGTAIANRPIAAHLLAGVPPMPSKQGWAAEQLHGWFLGDLSPFDNLRRLLGGTFVNIDRNGVRETRFNLAGRWFTEPANRTAFHGFDAFLDEFEEFADPSSIDIALSGGRNSTGIRRTGVVEVSRARSLSYQ